MRCDGGIKSFVKLNLCLFQASHIIFSKRRHLGMEKHFKIKTIAKFKIWRAVGTVRLSESISCGTSRFGQPNRRTVEGI